MDSRTDSLGQTWYYAYDLGGRTLSICDNEPGCDPTTTLATSNGEFVTQYTYNGFGEMVQERFNDQVTTSYDRRPDGRIATQTTTNEEPRYFAYDVDGNVVWQKFGDIQRVQVDDPANRQTHEITFDGDTTTTSSRSFDRMGRLVESTQWGDDGLTARATNMEYFGDRLIRSFDPTGRIIEEDHDLRGFVTQRREQRPVGFDVTNFVRNARGQVTSLVDPSGQTTTYTYDGFAALAGRTTPATATETWEYDALGRTTKWSQGGEWLAYGYNAQGLLHTEKWGGRSANPAETLSVERFYDAYGRPTRTDSYNIGVRDAGLANVSQALVQRWFAYDELGRLTSDAVNVGGHSLATSSSWSSVDHRWVQDVYYPTAGGTMFGMVVTRRFDGQGRVDRHEVGYTGLSSPSQVSTRWSGSRILARQHYTANAEYDEAAQYDAFGARTRWAYGRDGLDVYSATLERDILSRVRSAHTMFGTTSGPAYRWQGFLYDTRHHLTTEYAADGVSSPPSVGLYGQATNASVGAVAEDTLQASDTQRTRETNVGATLEIARDQQTVWQAQVPGIGGGLPTVARGPGHRLVDVMVDEATYFLGYDARGRITTSPGADLTFDVHNRLVTAQVEGLREAYLYDGDGVMVGRLGNGGLEQYAWESGQMIGAYDTQGSAKWEALWGQGQDVLLGFYDHMAGRDVVPVRDWRNNVVSALDMSTGLLLGHAEYTAEGRVTTFDNDGNVVCFEEGSGQVCPMPGALPFAFNGQWRSPLTGLSYMRNRWYSPRLGQFISHDPLHYVDSTNMYAFAAFDPINSWDPMGLEDWTHFHNPTADFPYWTESEPPEMEVPPQGYTRVWVIFSEIRGGLPFFNHSVVAVRYHNGAIDSWELDNNKGLAAVSRLEEGFRTKNSIDVPNTPQFHERWSDGDIEDVFETLIPDERAESGKKLTDEISLDAAFGKIPYSGIPTDGEEANCHAYTNTVLDCMGLGFPEDAQGVENPGYDSEVPRTDSRAETPKKPRKKVATSTRSENEKKSGSTSGLAE